MKIISFKLTESTCKKQEKQRSQSRTFIDSAYKWFSITWFGSCSNAGSHCNTNKTI